MGCAQVYRAGISLHQTWNLVPGRAFVPHPGSIDQFKALQSWWGDWWKEWPTTDCSGQSAARPAAEIRALSIGIYVGI
jgi:hypothetical protein